MSDINAAAPFLRKTIAARHNIIPFCALNKSINPYKYTFMTNSEPLESRSRASVIAYYCSIMEKHKNSPGTYGNWRSNLNYLISYVRARHGCDDIAWTTLTRDWVEAYRQLLIDRLPSHNSAASYFGKLRACLRSAFRDGLIGCNLADIVCAVPMEETERSYLTLDELQRMAAADCQLKGLKRAFLFSCLTGLRRSDIERLTWDRIVEEAGFTRIKFRQKKTRNLEYLDISPQATLLLGGRGDAAERVFADFHYSSHTLRRLREWAKSAKVAKHITFHTSRHTFAVLLLTTGSDLYTVQRLLGHRSIETTQIYAHICDRQKREAVMRLPTLFGE